MPTRAAPRSGARTRWPGASVQPSGTRYENEWRTGASKATSAMVIYLS
jgi:hypothetical protein